MASFELSANCNKDVVDVRSSKVDAEQRENGEHFHQHDECGEPANEQLGHGQNG